MQSKPHSLMQLAETTHRARIGYPVTLCVAALQLACSTPSETTPLLSTPITAHAEPQLPAWNRFDEAQRWPAINEAPWTLSGHAAHPYRALIRVSPNARDPYSRLVSDSTLPTGAVVVEDELGPEERPEQILAMEKQVDGRWEFLILSSTGGIRARGALTPCVRCHAEGTADSLFGPPRQPQPQPGK